MDSRTQARFLNHIFKFFAVQSNEGDEGSACGQGDQSGPAPAAAAPKPTAAADDGHPGTPDVAELLGALRATGFFVQYTDKSEFWGSTAGCRVIVTCKRSGTRVVLDSEGPCTCPPEEAMKKLLDGPRTGQTASRAPSPTPSTSAMLEDSTLNSAVKQEAVPALVRQRTFSREEGPREGRPSGAGAALLPESRRLSAPPAPFPGSSAWATLQGDELNVLAATDLLQEAMSLLSGVKKVNLRNTPVGPMRRLSAMGSASTTGRRASSDAFAMPLRPLSRTSSTSSGLASIMSSASTQSSQADTPRPSRPGKPGKPAAPAAPGQAAGPIRRTMSAVSSSGRIPLSTAPRPKQTAAKKGLTEESKSNSKFVPRLPSLLKTPSMNIGHRASTRSPRKVGSETNTPILPVQAPQACEPLNNPDAEIVRL